MRLAALVVILCVWSSAYATTAVIDAAGARPTSIPAEELRVALQTLAKERNFQIVYRAELVKGVMTSGAHGKLTTAQALSQLLQGTDLVYAVLDRGAVTILRAGAAPSVVDPKRLDHTQGVGKAKNLKSSPRASPMAQVDSGADAGGAAERSSSEPTQSTASLPLEEVIVTAQKVTQRAFDVPISLAVIEGSDLQKLLVTNLDDLAAVIPGLSVDDAGGITLRVAIRGISNYFGQEALVGSYLDEADVTTDGFLALNLGTYDLQRIEVLRGPQGTLYGEGSMGGTIRYITNKPNLAQQEMQADVTALFDQYGAPGERVQGVLNMPLVDNVLGLRAVGDVQHIGGWVDQPSQQLKNINSKDIAETRLEALWQPNTDLSVLGTQVIHRATLGPFIGEDDSGDYNQVFGLPTTPVTYDDYNISNVTASLNYSSVEAVDSATYLKHDNDALNFGHTLPLTAPPSPLWGYYAPSYRTVDESLSDEFRLSNATSEPWNWTLGGYYRHFTDTNPPSIFYFAQEDSSGSSPLIPYPNSQVARSSSWSEFADTNFKVTKSVTLGVGARYFTDNESFLASGDTQTQARRFTSTDPRIYVRYEVSETANVYASVAKGFRSGGFNAYGQPPYEPESVWTYELGTKMRFLDRALDIDADTFLSNYDGYQIIGVAPPPAVPQDITRNGGAARIKGAEGDVSLSPAVGWRFVLSGDYVDARFVEVSVLDSSYEVGDPLDMVPRYQVTGSIERDFTWAGRTASLRLNYSQRARETFRNLSIGPWYYSESDCIRLLDLNLGVQWTSNLKIGVFAQNLLNDRGYTGPDVIEASAARETPRTFGIDFGVFLP